MSGHGGKQSFVIKVGHYEEVHNTLLFLYIKQYTVENNLNRNE